MADIVDTVASLLDDLTEGLPSTDRLGVPNWTEFGSTDKCWRCGKQFGVEVEPGSEVRHHLIPKSEGGRDTSDNTSLICSNCHSVVHHFYLPTSKLGKSRTRNKENRSRIVGRFTDGTIMSQLLPSPDHSLHSCPKCSAAGIVVGVSEGYWNGEGMLVFLDCTSCGLAFVEPFIGTSKPPQVNPISAFIQAIEHGLSLAKDYPVPPELQAKVDALLKTIQEILKDLRAEMNAATRDAERSRMTKESAAKRFDEIRKQHVLRLNALLPEATKLTDACKPYVNKSVTDNLI